MKDKQKSLATLLSELVTNYEGQLQKYKRLLELTKQQQKKIETEEWEELNELVATRGEIMEEIDALKEESRPLKLKLSQKTGVELTDEFIFDLLQQSLPYSKQLRDVIEQIQQTLQQLKEIDESNQEQVTTKKDDLAVEERKVTKGMEVNQAYTGQGDTLEGKFIDEKE